MKEGWERKKIKDISVLIADGDWIESKDQSDEGIRLIQTGNIGNGVFKAKEDKPHYISECTFYELGCTEIFSGDCLVSRLPEPVGRACLIPEIGCRMITAVDCSIIRFKEIVLPKLFIYYTQSATYNRDVNNLTTGTTRKRISRKNLESILIPIPPLEEQERIVEELDCLSGVIEKKKQQLKELDALAQSIFYEMFGNPVENDRGWEVKKLGEVCSKLTDGSHNPPKGVDCSDFYMLSSQNVFNDKIDISTVRYLTKDDFERENRRTKVKEGDILLTIVGTIGRCALVKAPLKNITLQRSVAVLTPKEILNSIYFIYVLRLMNQVLEREARGVAQKGIYLNQLSNIIILVPPLELQQQFADKIELIEKQKELIRKSIEEVEMLFNSRMEYYFN